MPFTPEQFFEIFARYNEAVFPMQIVLILSALAACALASRPKPFSGEIICVLLAYLWLWSGIFYHLLFFSEINPAAYFFAAAFILQGFLFLYTGAAKKNLRFCFKLNSDAVLGAIFILYALIFYPLLGFFAGRVYPSAPTFGAPCPTTIFTFGLLLWANEQLPLKLLVIPVIWTVIGTSAAVAFGVTEDFGLLAAGTVGAAFIMRRGFSPKKENLS